MTWVSCLRYRYIRNSATKATSAIISALAANSCLPEQLSAFLVVAELLLFAFAKI